MEYGAFRNLIGKAAGEAGAAALDQDCATTIEANDTKARRFVNARERSTSPVCCHWGPCSALIFGYLTDQLGRKQTRR